MSFRYLVALAVGLLITIGLSTEAHIVPDTGENPRSVTLVFKSGTATFNLSKGVAENVVFRVGDKSYSTSFAGCTPLEHIRFDSAIFDAGENPTEGTFTLLFQMGAEESRAFGLLPRIQISFARGTPSQRLISREVAKNTAFSSSLCPNETSAKNRYSRKETLMTDSAGPPESRRWSRTGWGRSETDDGGWAAHRQ